MSRSEKSILNETLCEVSAVEGSLFYRNNTGSAWTGRQLRARIGSMIKVTPGMVILEEARPITFGLPGSGDIMGAAAGRPIAIEAKTSVGRQSQQQIHFQAAWERAGGVYILARDPIVARQEVEAIRLLADLP